ncbi:hypothetical protein G7Y89_g528 [Cudoniella acicularis]|uniref:Uncharacterized protein n=1 Tax=Cudoniella acicularis TaxID=354080 RepID=A0A8H4W887_9HELO|nr:hypothetical protein G7Y89_g528 [Cudoniella acicularis]
MLLALPNISRAQQISPESRRQIGSIPRDARIVSLPPPVAERREQPTVDRVVQSRRQQNTTSKPSSDRIGREDVQYQSAGTCNAQSRWSFG